MRDLTLIEKDILAVLTTRLPYSFETIKNMFLKLESIDDTIRALELKCKSPYLKIEFIIDTITSQKYK